MKSIFHIFVLIFILLTANLHVSAQQSVLVTGNVTDEFGRDLEGALIEIITKSRKIIIHTFSDNTGKFRLAIPLELIKSDKQARMRTRLNGYRPFYAGISLDQPEITRNILLNFDPLGTGKEFSAGIRINKKNSLHTYDIRSLNSDQIYLPLAQNSGISLQGRIPGLRVFTDGGNPDLTPEVLLGAAESIFNGNQPLVKIDGIRSPWGLEDIPVDDIRDIMVIHGPAGAAQFGIWGANGVIELFTDRGEKAPGVPVFRIRSEYGVGLLPSHDFPVSTHHHYLTDGTKWIDKEGNEVSISGRIPDDSGPNGTVFQDNDYFLTIFDNTDSFYESGHFYSNHATVDQTSGTSTWKLSASSNGNSGIVKNLDGYSRNTFRMNFLKHVRNDLQVSVGGYISKSDTDDPKCSNTDLNPFRWLTGIPVGVDIDPGKTFFLSEQEDSLSSDILIPGLDVPNPIVHADLFRKEVDRIRAMSNINILYRPSGRTVIESNLGVDRLDLNDTEFIPYELEGSQFGYWLPFYFDINRDLVSYNVDVSFSRELNTRTIRFNWQISYGFQDISNDTEKTYGLGLNIDDIGESHWKNDLTAFTEKTGFSVHGLSLVSEWNYSDKIIGDFVLRTDHNSQLDNNEKLNSFFRASAAYRIVDEPWFRFSEYISDFKLRYAIGTAGSLRNFKPDNLFLSDHITPTPQYSTLPKDLKPEYSVSSEFGMDIIILDKASLAIDYAATNTKNQIFRVENDLSSSLATPLWQNLGTVESDYLALDLRINLANSHDFSWTTGFILSRADQRIKELNGSYYYNTNKKSFYLQEGDDLGSIYGVKWAGSLTDLGDFGLQNKDQFQINDDGLLVWVGTGNTWLEGFSKNLWGTSATVTGEGISRDLSWGMPIEILDESGNSTNRLGKLSSDFTWSWTNTIRWKEFTVNALMEAQVGGSIYNFAAQSAYRESTHFTIDQSGKPEGMKKPIDYYSKISGPYGYNSWFMENGSFVRLRNFSVKYRFSRDKIRDKLGESYADAIGKLAVGFSLRNWITWTDYTGFDPDTGGSIYRFDDGLYPNSRLISAFVEIEF